jgi:ABC-type Zn uptake system ZnuABC Zn-binding protein ZnuA
MKGQRFLLVFLLLLSLSACQPASAPAASTGLKVIAAESFLADIVQNVAGDRAQVSSLIPIGVDPHSFEMTPKDVASLSQADIIVLNGMGLESWLDKTVTADSQAKLILNASDGLKVRTPNATELVDEPQDPHFWMDPTRVIGYARNIRDGLSRVDPDGKTDYEKNADAYIAKLTELDGWISSQVSQIPAEKRLLVTNHETFGYYADRYGFTITGTIIPGISTDSTPTAQQMAALIDQIRATKTPAIFLETGVNPDLADQIAQETGAKVITDLYTHSITASYGPAPTYIAMLRYDTAQIVAALK